MSSELLFPTCPNGCGKELNETDMKVSEGVLKECVCCGQLLSSCSRQYYVSSNQNWNTEQGTWPTEKDMKRLIKRKTRDIQTIRQLLKKRQEIHLLDVGSSNGAFVHFANQAGLNAEGIDPSEKAVKNGLERGLKIHQGYLQDAAFEESQFDVITLYEVIEHVDKPIELLLECRRILSTGGVLLIGTGNIDSWTRHIKKQKWDFFDMNAHGGHISFFSPASLDVLAKRTGFEMKKVRTASFKLFERGDVSPLQYRLVKLFSEMLSFPARLLNKGHQMEVFLVAK